MRAHKVREQPVCESPKFGFGCVSELCPGADPSKNRAGPARKTPPWCAAGCTTRGKSSEAAAQRTLRRERAVLDVIEAIC